MNEWEYERASLVVRNIYPVGEERERAGDAFNDRWIELLNQKGAEGWELVSEHSFGDGGPEFYASRSGTMKRPRQNR